MKRERSLRSFDLYQFLLAQGANHFNAPFFLADSSTYANAKVDFPFRTFNYGIGITYSGEGDLFRIGCSNYSQKKGSLTTIGPGMICQWAGDYTAEHDTLYFTEELLTGLDQGSFLRSLSFFFHGGEHVLQLDPRQVEMMRSLFTLLKQFKEQPEAIPGLVHSLLRLAASFHAEQAAQQGDDPRSLRTRTLVTFKKHVAEHHPEHKEVSFYAGKLNISPKYLSEVLRSEVGMSAKAFIDDHVMFQAKSLLKQTGMNIKEICYWLGYEDASHFTKTFRKSTGMSPSEYRDAGYGAVV